MKYTVTKKAEAPEFPEDFHWDSQYWQDVPAIEIASFHPESSAHHPKTQVKMIHLGNAMIVHYRVDDQYIRSVQQGHNAMVCQDSCVEFFVKPKQSNGYISFEANAGGHLLSYFIEDATRTPDGFAKYTRSTETQAAAVKVLTSKPRTVDPEITEPQTWYATMIIPVYYFENFTPPIGDLSGQTWKGNFFKCGDQTSHPHWGSWAPIGEELNFHQPGKFGEIHFE